VASAAGPQGCGAQEIALRARVDAVGKTGNARTVGCHLHFEIHHRGHPIDPEPILSRWDRHS